MSQVAGPYGLITRKYLGDTPFSSGMQTYVLTTNQTKGFFFGDPVGLVAGQPTPLAASPTPTLSANSPIGIFYGCSYMDPIRGFVNAQYLGANAITNGATNVKLKIMDYPWLVMQVQADGPVTYASVGLNASLNIPASGSTVTGDSILSLNSASIAVGLLAVRIYDLVVNAGPSPGASSMPGDPFTDCLVVWNFGVHRFMNSTGQ
jgi:hypothetical protein